MPTPVVVDSVVVGELARAAQEAQDTSTDHSDEPFDVGVGDGGDGMEVRAETMRPPGNVDALVRWNSCVRTIQRERLEPEPESGEQPLE